MNIDDFIAEFPKQEGGNINLLPFLELGNDTTVSFDDIDLFFEAMRSEKVLKHIEEYDENSFAKVKNYINAIDEARSLYAKGCAEAMLLLDNLPLILEVMIRRRLYIKYGDLNFITNSLDIPNSKMSICFFARCLGSFNLSIVIQDYKHFLTQAEAERILTINNSYYVFESLVLSSRYAEPRLSVTKLIDVTLKEHPKKWTDHACGSAIKLFNMNEYATILRLMECFYMNKQRVPEECLRRLYISAKRFNREGYTSAEELTAFLEKCYI